MQHDQTLSFFAKYIEEQLGIVYAEHNYFQLRNRLDEIARFMGTASLDELHAKALQGIQGAFKQFLLDVATNNETSFFRDPKIFSALEKTLLTPMEFKPNQLRIWSAASSTGQEALSMAMLISEFAKKGNVEIPYSIVATDISERVLEKAKKAAYSQLEVQRGLPVTHLIKYFKKLENDHWVASPQLTSNISFRKMNLKESFPFEKKFHLILCRNVLIYQNVEGKKEILGRMLRELEPNGLLVLGSGESLIGISTDFEQVSSEGVVIYRKKSPALMVA